MDSDHALTNVLGIYLLKAFLGVVARRMLVKRYLRTGRHSHSDYGAVVTRGKKPTKYIMTLAAQIKSSELPIRAALTCLSIYTCPIHVARRFESSTRRRPPSKFFALSGGVAALAVRRPT